MTHVAPFQVYRSFALQLRGLEMESTGPQLRVSVSLSRTHLGQGSTWKDAAARRQSQRVGARAQASACVWEPKLPFCVSVFSQAALAEGLSQEALR